MITFKQYLTEDELIMVTPSQAAKFIAENCQQFLRDTEFRINHGFTHAIIESPVLYRGLGNFSRSNGYILSGQRNRTPVDSSRELTETLDTYFKQHFRYPYRQQGVFCSGRPGFAASYGNTLLFFQLMDMIQFGLTKLLMPTLHLIGGKMGNSQALLEECVLIWKK